MSRNVFRSRLQVQGQERITSSILPAAKCHKMESDLISTRYGLVYSTNIREYNFVLVPSCTIIIIGCTALGGPWPPQSNVAFRLPPPRQS